MAGPLPTPLAKHSKRARRAAAHVLRASRHSPKACLCKCSDIRQPVSPARVEGDDISAVFRIENRSRFPARVLAATDFSHCEIAVVPRARGSYVVNDRTTVYQKRYLQASQKSGHWRGELSNSSDPRNDNKKSHIPSKVVRSNDRTSQNTADYNCQTVERPFATCILMPALKTFLVVHGETRPWRKGRSSSTEIGRDLCQIEFYDGGL